MPDLRRVIATSARALPAALATLALVIPAAAAAQTTAPSGGAAPNDAASVQAAPVSTAGPLLPAPVDLGGRIGALLGMQVTFSGSLPSAAGRAVDVQRDDPRKGWVPVANAVAGADGAFSAAWTVNRVGVSSMRAVPSTAGVAQAASNQTPLAAVTGYRVARATFFGPGLYGRRTACGLRLTRSLRGIAHRSLPCGSIVELVYRGRVLRVPVVDRGPYARGVRYDLTRATARDLGFTRTDDVGAAQVAPPPKRQATG